MSTFLLIVSGLGTVIGMAILVQSISQVDPLDTLREKSSKTNAMTVGFCIFGICFSEFLMLISRNPETHDPDFLVSLSTLIISLTVIVAIIRTITLVIRGFLSKGDNSFDK